MKLEGVSKFSPINIRLNESIQCPLDIATLDIAAALAIATSTPVTNLRQYINSDLGYNNLIFFVD